MGKKNDILQFFLNLGILVVVGVIAQLLFTKIDLTEEKRHTLTDATIDMLAELDDQVYVKCYLHGEFPAKFKRLEQAIQERLDEFVDYSDGSVSYDFIDPYEIDDARTKSEVETALIEQGLQFTVLPYEDNGAIGYDKIWPCAIITYRNQDIPVNLYKSQDPNPSEQMVNGSVNNLEYELASKLRTLLSQDRPTIAVLEGHGELDDMEMSDFLQSLADQQYLIERVEIDGQLTALSDKFEKMKYRTNKYDLLIVAKPDSMIDNKDKILIDQYLMNGGKILWMIDPVLTDLDSLRNKQQTYGVSNEMGLYDMLFDYGVRLNRGIVLDYQCAPIAFDAGPKGNQRNYELFDWYYAPVILPGDTVHPIAANLDPIFMEFASSLEFVGEDTSVRKTPLLVSSPLSKLIKTPVRVNTAVVNFGIDYFRNGNQPQQVMGALLEGRFNSNFTYRIPDTLKTDTIFSFRETSRPTKMIVIADGDIGRQNIIEGSDGRFPIPLGFDRYTQRVLYDNREFLLNAVNYLLDDQALISMRSRNIVLRELNEERILEERTKWQVLNVAIPLLAVIIFGFLQGAMRKRKFAA